MGTFSTCRWYTSIVPYCTILYRLYHLVPPVPYCTALVLPVPSSSTLVPHCTACTGTCTVCTACTRCTAGQPTLYRMYCSSTTVRMYLRQYTLSRTLHFHETYRAGAVTDLYGPEKHVRKVRNHQKYENDQLELRKSNICIK